MALPLTQDQFKQSFASPLCTKRIVFIGARIINNSGGECEVTSVLSNYPAALDGIKSGDVILRIDEVEVRTRYDAIKTIRQKSAEEAISLTIRRNGRILKKQIQPKFNNTFHDSLALSEIYFKDQPVRLAIVMGEINNTLSGSLSPFAFEQWKEGIKSELLGVTENLFIQGGAGEKYSSIVD